MNNTLSPWSRADRQQALRRVEQAVRSLDEEKTQSRIWTLIRSLQLCMEEEAAFYVPLAEEEPRDLLEIPKLDLSGLRRPARSFRKVEMEKGGLAYCAFTSLEELEAGPLTEYQMVPVQEILDLAAEDETVLGLILNPWSLSILLNKELLDQTLNEEEPDGPDWEEQGFHSALYIDHTESCQQDAEVIVSAAFHPFSFREPCPAALLEACGPALQELCFNLPEPSAGEIAVTEAPNLKADRIFHAALPDPVSEKGCSALIGSILTLAEELGVHSIAIPAIGSEEGAVDPDLPFAVIAAAAWFNAHPRSAMSVTITCRSQKTYQDFVSYLFE